MKVYIQEREKSGGDKREYIKLEVDRRGEVSLVHTSFINNHTSHVSLLGGGAGQSCSEERTRQQGSDQAWLHRSGVHNELLKLH